MIAFQILAGVLFKLLPHGVRRAVFVKELLEVSVQRAHLADGVHRVVGGTELSEARRAHELEKAQTGLSVRRTLKVLIVVRQYLMPGVPYGAVAFNIGVDQPVEVRRVTLDLFRSPPVL